MGGIEPPSVVATTGTPTGVVSLIGVPQRSERDEKRYG